MNVNKKICTLYIAYDGVMQPLGLSQVIAYVELLSNDFEVHLLSFEKKTDLKNKDQLKKINDRLKESNIYWHYLVYHKNPSFLATSYDLLAGHFVSFYICIKNNIQLVHTRSYVPSVIALFLKKILRVKFIFDMRGFWADENIDNQTWKRESWIYSLAKWFEKKFILSADHIISLTNAGINEINKFPYVDSKLKNISRITTCTDLRKFSVQIDKRDTNFVLGYIGSAQSWYDFDLAIVAFLKLLQEKPEASFLILNRGEHEFIFNRLKYFAVPLGKVELLEASSENIPSLINRMHAGVFFIRPTFSKLASAPTKLGEFLACGVPCITNAGVGDLDEILRSNQTGIVLNNPNEESIHEGIKKLITIADDSESQNRARQTAEENFSLMDGYYQYKNVYEGLLQTKE